MNSRRKLRSKNIRRHRSCMMMREVRKRRTRRKRKKKGSVRKESRRNM